MEWSLSGRPADRAQLVLSATMVVATLLLLLCVPGLATAQPPSASDRNALARLTADRGGSPADLDAILSTVDDAASKGLPTESLLNKVREGLAKGVAPPRIPPVIREMAGHLETADRILRETSPGVEVVARRAAVMLLAEALGGGVSDDETVEISRQTQQTGATLSPDTLAGAAKALAFIKDAQVPAADATRVVAEAARRGYRPRDLLDLGREIKRREVTYQRDLNALRALGDAIARGERPERLFGDSRVERPTRPEAPVERPTRPEPIERPERPERPQTPERPRG
jgi:hypothetical protein